MTLKIKGKGDRRDVVVAETGVVVGRVREHKSASEQRNRVTETKHLSTWCGFTPNGRPIYHKNSQVRRLATLKDWCRASIWGISDDV